MYLAYIDDSDTRSKQQKWQVLGAVLIHESSLLMLELIAANVIENLMPAERLDEFSEFHACELYGGYGVFEGIDQAKRLEAIGTMLRALGGQRAKVVFGAVDLEHLRKQPYASAIPLDIAFRICIDGIDSFFLGNIEQVRKGKDPDGDSHAILIADLCDKAIKSTLQKSFRSLKERFKLTGEGLSKLGSVHDDLYFGDSRYSLGIQMADLCSYFIARHLAGDAEIEHYYKLIEPLIVSARHDP